jgi:hypothetical protein
MDDSQNIITDLLHPPHIFSEHTMGKVQTQNQFPLHLDIVNIKNFPFQRIHHSQKLRK